MVHTYRNGKKYWSNEVTATQDQIKYSSQNFLPPDPVGGSQEQPLNENVKKTENEGLPSVTIQSRDESARSGDRTKLHEALVF